MNSSRLSSPRYLTPRGSFQQSSSSAFTPIRPQGSRSAFEEENAADVDPQRSSTHDEHPDFNQLLGESGAQAVVDADDIRVVEIELAS